MCRNSNTRIVRHGFTMIELLIVMAILAIAAAIVVPMASSAGSMQLRAAVNIVAADLEYAKSLSISRGQKYAVIFDKTTESYRVTDETGTTISHPVKKGFPFVVDFRNDGRLAGVDIVDVSFDGLAAVSFDSLGSPYHGTGGSAASLNSGVITVRAGGLTRTVNVEAVTGYITVSN
jgi:prepilin-type N-terminal cleavage/methylation domain-containing protein